MVEVGGGEVCLLGMEAISARLGPWEREGKLFGNELTVIPPVDDGRTGAREEEDTAGRNKENKETVSAAAG